MVSICLITYNHQQYISEALDSILSQETGFPFEIVIGEDCSTDLTRDICIQYRDKYPEKIKLLPSEENLGMMQNFIRTYEACEGMFIAFTEGDDYWTDKRKLQKQVDFLINYPEYSTCFHNVRMVFTKNKTYGERPYHSALGKEIFITEDLLNQWFIPTTSVMIRKYPDFILPYWFQHCKSGDIPFILLLSLKGPIKYMDEMMGVYRVHDTGISGTHNGYDKVIAMVYIYENFNIHTKYRYRQKIREAIVYEIGKHLPFEIERMAATVKAAEVKSPAPERNHLFFRKVYHKARKIFAGQGNTKE